MAPQPRHRRRWSDRVTIHVLNRSQQHGGIRDAMSIKSSDRRFAHATHYSCFWTLNSKYRGVNFTTESDEGWLIIDS